MARKRRACWSCTRNPLVQGFTTNPTLMRKADITDYEGFARDILSLITDRPISFEVFADDFDEMERQARLHQHLGPERIRQNPGHQHEAGNCLSAINKLSHVGIKLNVTAILTLEQVREVVVRVEGGAPSNVSVFAGRIADTGVDPVPMMAEAVRMTRRHPQMEVIWASPRELLNVFQADESAATSSPPRPISSRSWRWSART